MNRQLAPWKLPLGMGCGLVWAAVTKLAAGRLAVGEEIKSNR